MANPTTRHIHEKKNTVRIETLHEPLALEQLTFVDDYLLLSSLDCSIHESEAVTKRLHNQISVGSDPGVPQSWPLLSLTLLLIITRATIFVLTGQSVNNCYHATISTPPSDLTAPLPLLGAFNELFTSRLNIDKFCVNLRNINSDMLKTTRCTSRSLRWHAKG